ncbi:hypothetical protein MLD38_037107 [Melastoma candidum]|uniref:Uncharacterized protein n=1 Tax=Melastoma candidum TaxID=119954 RepID=A0ACB9LMY6_9MYRT|nr:hypothetical protein MLD38_037107 [Melastoma candidum]
MNSLKSLIAAMIIAVVISCSLGTVKGKDLTHQVGYCNTKINAKESKEEGDSSRLINWLIYQTPVLDYRQHVSYNGYYAAAECTVNISPDDCTGCLENISNQISALCGLTDGAQLNVPACHLRFEHYQFPVDW